MHLTIFFSIILNTQNTSLFYKISVSFYFSLKAFLISRETENDSFLY